MYIGPVSQQSSIYLWHYQETQLSAIGEYTEFMEQWTAGKDATGYYRENAAGYRIYYVDDPTSDDPLRLVPEEPFF